MRGGRRKGGEVHGGMELVGRGDEVRALCEKRTPQEIRRWRGRVDSDRTAEIDGNVGKMAHRVVRFQSDKQRELVVAGSDDTTGPILPTSTPYIYFFHVFPYNSAVSVVRL